MRWRVATTAVLALAGSATAQRQVAPARADPPVRSSPAPTSTVRGSVDLRAPVMLNRTLSIPLAGRPALSARVIQLPGPQVHIADAKLVGSAMQVTVANHGTDASTAKTLEAYLTVPSGAPAATGNANVDAVMEAASNVDKFGLYLNTFTLGAVPALQPGQSQTLEFNWQGFGNLAVCGKAGQTGANTKCIPQGSPTLVVVLRLH